jgi:hypothetical protein
VNSKRNRTWIVRLALVSVCALAMALLLLPWGNKTNAQGHAPVHLATDWSNRHMVYSSPSSIPQALRLQAEPRYSHQWTRRYAVPTQAQAAQ